MSLPYVLLAGKRINMPPIVRGLEGYGYFYTAPIAIRRADLQSDLPLVLFLLTVTSDLPPEQRPCIIFEELSDANDTPLERAVKAVTEGSYAVPGPLYREQNVDGQLLTSRLLNLDERRIQAVYQARCLPQHGYSGVGILNLTIASVHTLTGGPETPSKTRTFGHSNALLVGPDWIERYEPEGSTASFYNQARLDELLAQALPHYRYYPPLAECRPMTIHLASATERYRHTGYCVAYSTFYAITRAINPLVSREEIIAAINSISGVNLTKLVLGFWTAGIRRMRETFQQHPVVKKIMEDYDPRLVVSGGEVLFEYPTPDLQTRQLMAMDQALKLLLVSPRLLRQYRSLQS